MSLFDTSNSKINVGCFLTIGSCFTAELLASCGFDWLCIDLQHGMVGYQKCIDMIGSIRLFGVAPFVRVPTIDSSIGRVLDAGATGVFIPDVRTSEQAKRATSECYYPPGGIRSIGPSRAIILHGRDYVENSSRIVNCVLMIESEDGVKNVKEIALTAGVDAVLIGAADLRRDIESRNSGSVSERMDQCIESVLGLAKSTSTPVGIYADDIKTAKQRVEQGFDFTVFGTDSWFLVQSAMNQLAQLRSISQSTKSKPTS